MMHCREIHMMQMVLGDTLYDVCMLGDTLYDAGRYTVCMLGDTLYEVHCWEIHCMMRDAWCWDTLHGAGRYTV